ncbi:MAG: glycosyltransferase [Celeribacter sp.]
MRQTNEPTPSAALAGAPFSASHLTIFTRDPHKFSETFVRRRIQYLNGGNVSVVSLTGAGPGTCLEKPELSATNQRSMSRLFKRRQMQRREQDVVEFLKQQGTTHVVAEFGYVATEFADLLKDLSIPVYCTFRGNDASARLRDRAYVAHLKELFDRLDGIITVSDFLRRNLAAVGLHHPRTLVAPSGVDTTVFTPGPPTPGLCFNVGRLVPKKQPLPMIRAFAKVAEKHDLVLEIAGEGPLENDARDLAKSLGMSGRIRFLGRLDHADVRARMRNASVYLQNFETPPDGDTEGMPTVIQEAMACGVPIVTTRHSGVPEHVFDGISGRVVEPGDVDAFAAALGQLAADPALRETLGRNARAHAVAELDYRDLFKRIETFMGLRGQEAV